MKTRLILALLLVGFEMVALAQSPAPENREIQERFQNSWKEVFGALDDLGLSQENVFNTQLAPAIEALRIQSVSQISKPQYANRHSGFYFEDQPLILLDSREAVTSSDSRFCLLSTHEGLSQRKIGDQDGVFSLYLCMAKDVVQGDPLLPKSLSKETWRKLVSTILTSEGMGLRTGPSADVYRWDSNLDEQEIMVPKGFEGMESGTFVGGGGDANTFDFLKRALYADLESRLDQLSESELDRLFGEDKIRPLLSWMRTFLDKTGYQTIRCEKPDPQNRPIIYWPGLNEKSGDSWSARGSLTVYAESGVPVEKSVAELIYHRNRVDRLALSSQSSLSGNSILVTSYLGLKKIAEERGCTGFFFQRRPVVKMLYPEEK